MQDLAMISGWKVCECRWLDTMNAMPPAYQGFAMNNALVSGTWRKGPTGTLQLD